MRAADPTAWTTLSLEKMYWYTFDVCVPRLFFFHGSNPTNPFISGERREVIPYGRYVWISGQRFS